MTIFVNWLIVLAALLLFFAGLYLVVKLAVKNAASRADRKSRRSRSRPPALHSISRPCQQI